MKIQHLILLGLPLLGALARLAGEEFPKPFSAPCTEREGVFEFTRRPAVKQVGEDRYEIAFAVKGYCDVTVAVMDQAGKVVRHLAAGVLGSNAPAPFQKNALSQTILWNGKDDLDSYPKDPGRLRISVRLGLRPVFERLLGSSDPRNLPGFVSAVAADAEGVYLFSRGGGAHAQVHLRKFDHDGNYVMSLAPPPSDLPKEKLGGRTSVEYEKGRFAHFGPDLFADLGYDGNVLPGFDGLGNMQPAMVDRRIIYCNAGPNNSNMRQKSLLHYVYTDGSTDVQGMAGTPFVFWGVGHTSPILAASPDGKWLYMSGFGDRGGKKVAVVRCGLGGGGKPERFAGELTLKETGFSCAPGSDHAHLNNPVWLDCDSQGRVYVADNYNNRVQIFAPDGTYLKTIPVDGPGIVLVHKKTGGIYVHHRGEVRGRGVDRLTKFSSFDKPEEEFRFDGVSPAPASGGGEYWMSTIIALDSWTAKPRVWVAGAANKMGITIWEEDGKTLKRLADLDEAVKKGSGDEYSGRWSGSISDRVNCDPVREELYSGFGPGSAGFGGAFDLKTGKIARRVALPIAVDDIAFDKKGYMHAQSNPGVGFAGVVRWDPSQSSPHPWNKRAVSYKEVPYDYGVELSKAQVWSCMGAIPVKSQPGAKYFQDGLGVNMRGELAVESNIYHIPRMEDESFNAAFATRLGEQSRGRAWFTDTDPRAGYLKAMEEKLKRGEEIYSIKRLPGIPLAGATAWTYAANGELREECAVIAASLMVGLQIDEDGYLYFSNERARISKGKPFLADTGSNYGTNSIISHHNRTPMTSTFMKTKGARIRWILKDATIPMDPLPNRQQEVAGAWVEGDVEWMYAGLSPNAGYGGCTCPATRFHLDWFKRSYLPEGYRRSIGILDTNGNLILHLGRYGNCDDALRMKPGAEDIALTLPRFISGTDNYLSFDDWGERLVQLRLAYHAEETVAIGGP